MENAITRDHLRYQALSKDVVENLLHHGFTAETDNRIRLHQSEKAFAEAFPEEAERVEMLDKLEMNLNALGVALKRVRRDISPEKRGR